MEATSDVRWSAALKNLDAPAQKAIEATLTRQDLPAGAPLFLEGKRADRLYIIERGRVRLFQYTSGGKEYSSGVWSQGYLIGLISTVLGGNRFVSAETVDDTALLALGRADLLRHMRAIPAFALNISYLLALLAQHSIRRAAPLALESVDIKLGRALLKLAVRDDASQSHVITGITQEKLATLVGASRPWINRKLSLFERQGLIRRDKHAIVLVDLGRCHAAWLDGPA